MKVEYSTNPRTCRVCFFQDKDAYHEDTISITTHKYDNQKLRLCYAHAKELYEKLALVIPD